MQGSSLVTLLLLALTLACQPYSVLAGIVLVATRRGVAKECAYVAGWVAALGVVLGLALTSTSTGGGSASTTTVAVGQVVIGVVLLAVLLIRWRRPVTVTASTPAWFDALDSMAWPLAFVLGAFLPNYLIVVAAATEMRDADLSGSALVLWGVCFVVVASLGVAAPLLVLAIKRDRAPQVYAGWRAWILAHNRAVSYGTGAVLSGMLLLTGLSNLAL